MSVAAYRIRKQVSTLFEAAFNDPEIDEAGLFYIREALAIIAEELELEAERSFTQKLNPDPITTMTKEGGA